ncbi:alpha/beta fold hydrolase [Micromonospora sp. CPCC 205711]|uniref:alpha/beta hydrolase n=1 Tax=Micromonospora sp. CPCC 205547 TaxID=3122400 RepID=UPI002FEEB838
MSVRPLGVAPAGRPVAALAVLAALALALGGYGLARAGSGLTTRHVTVAGVPLTEVRAGPADGRRPGVVIAHGFAGSARLMRPLADTVARHGAVALLLDFAGHGANPARLPGAGRDSTASRATLTHDLDVAVAHLRRLPDVDPARIVLVGHSMGAGAVTRYAADHPEIVRTVAISLPDAADLPYGRPRSLALVVGGAEFPSFHQAAEEALRRAPPWERGMTVVPFTEHISVLFAGQTHEVVAGSLPGRVDGPPPEPTARLAAAGLLLLGFGLGFVPLVRLVHGRRRDAWRGARGEAPAAAWRPLLLALAAAGIAALLAGALPTSRLPLAVGGYVTGFLLLIGLLLAAAARWWPGLPPVDPVAPAAPAARLAAPVASGFRAPVRDVVMAVVLTGYALVAVAVPIHLGLTSAVPVGARWWLLPLVAAGCLALLLGAERVTAGRSWRYAAVGGIAVLALTVAAVVGLAPGFVLLVVPLFAVLVGWQAAWAAVLRRAGAPAWLPALVGAALLAWPVATTLPLG